MRVNVRSAYIWTSVVVGCLAGLSSSAFAAQADLTNSWTSTTSGYWESLNWSMGGFPGTNQAILFTNANSKILTISSLTAQNYPETLHVSSLKISSPTNSVNEFLMNYSGTATPLIIGDGDLSSGTSTGSLIVGANSSFVMLGSALLVQNNEMGVDLGAFSVGGTFDEGDGSQVKAATFLRVGDIGSGTYNMTNSTLYVGNYEIVGGFPSAFNQYGGTNLTVSLTVTNSGNYNLYGGTLAFTNAAWNQQQSINSLTQAIVLGGGTFNQWGGKVAANLYFQGANGNYRLYGGVINSGNFNLGPGGFSQSGGTNYAGSILFQGTSPGARGSGYALSGGYLSSSSVYLGVWSMMNPGAMVGYTFNQSGGLHSSGTITIAGGENSAGNFYGGHYQLSGGTLQASGISLNIGGFDQSGGTNQVGTVSLTAHSSMSLSGGSLAVQNMQLADAFQQTGGSSQIGNVTIYNNAKCSMQGGQITIGNLQVSGGGAFQHASGTCSISGLLTLDNGTWQEGTNGQTFGQLQLGPGANSGIVLPANGCMLQFADSSGLNWASTGILNITNWNGSHLGGGSHRILFGNSVSALTGQQLAHIQFVNPSGVAAGSYPASILASGEIVPYVNQTNILNQTNTGPAPFFNGQAALGSDWYFLPLNGTQAFGYYSLAAFPFVLHEDMGWEYFVDAGNAQRGAYFYDFTDRAFFYTDPDTFPYLYDFNLNTWVYYLSQNGATDRYTSNPRWFYDFNMGTWINNL